jgi:nucleotide-binding universal stress UspA family protein
MHTILAAIKRSSASAEAIALAIELASERNAELILVHVIPTLDGGSFDEDEIAIAREPTDEDRAILTDAAAAAHCAGVATRTLLLRGPTADEIVAAADHHDVDLIVVGSRGHSAIASAILGNISLRVLRKSSRPVLIVRKQVLRHPATTNAASVPASALSDLSVATRP